ncbi:MAG: formate dehydrogenase subunit gamma [Rhodobacter sp.]|nr:formate dehydrogenase subunit gamma [Rhodobacter sp.]
MTLIKSLLASLCLAMLLCASAVAQETAAPAPDRSATGGAQTLEDILARQKGLKIDDSFRRQATGDPLARPGVDALGTLGGASDPELWRALRYGTAEITASTSTPGATLLVQDGGMAWLEFRAGPLRKWGGNALLIVLVLLGVFYVLRRRIMIEAGPAGITIERFKPVERFGHWLLAGSFILLGITGLISLFGRIGLLPWMGPKGFSVLAIASKWIHNNVSWAFMLGLVLVFVMWVFHNLPSRHDITWLLKGGGLFSKHSHPPAKKFNAGQKIIFWSVILMGASISVSGLALLFPFQINIFDSTFHHLNDLGVPGWIGLSPLPTELTPHQEMQFAQAWHAIMAFAMMCVILAHIYIGSIGMEGAFDAMGDGQVDLNWAKEHHSLWVAEVQAKAAAPDTRSPGSTAPAE